MRPLRGWDQEPDSSFGGPPGVRSLRVRKGSDVFLLAVCFTDNRSLCYNFPILALFYDFRESERRPVCTDLPEILLLAAVLAASWALPLSASAEKPAEIYSHEHRESHTTTRTESSTRTSSSTTSTHTSSSVNVDKAGTAEILGGLLVPNPNRKVPGLVRAARESLLAPVFAGRDSKGLWGLWDARGREILAPRYKSLEAASQGLLAAREGKKDLLYFTREGRPAQAPAAPDASSPSRKRAAGASGMPISGRCWLWCTGKYGGISAKESPLWSMPRQIRGHRYPGPGAVCRPL